MLNLHEPWRSGAACHLTADAGRDREARATVGAGGQFAPTIHDPLDPSGPLIPFVCLDGRLASDPNSPVRIGVNRGVHAPVAVARVHCLRRAQAGAQLESIASKAGAAPAVFFEDDRLFLDDSASGSISSSAGSSPAGSS